MLGRIKTTLIVCYLIGSVAVLHWYIFSEFTINLKPDNKGYFFKPCQCLKHRDRSESELSPSSCSQESTWYGPHQKVISFSLFRSHLPIAEPFEYFTNGIQTNLRQIKKYYPGWVVRIHSNITLDDDLCQVACSDLVFWCDIRESILPELNITNGRVWRFIPLGDESVDIFLSRDIDSYIFLREKEVVAEWEFLSDKPFHLTRDIPYSRPVMAGAWGAKNYVLGWERAKELRSIILERAKAKHGITNDEWILGKQVYDPYWDEFLQHDSYNCEFWNNTRPFPRRRTNRMIRVALSNKHFGRFLARPCPLACRPVFGMSWNYC